MLAEKDAQQTAARSVREDITVDQARGSLLAFTQFTNRHYRASPVHYFMSRRLDMFLADCAAGKSPRLIMSLPPRHGKSELVSRRLPAFAFGHHPDLQIISTSYSADLSGRFNREVQRIIDSPEYRRLFPDTKLNQNNIRTSGRGSYLRNSDIFEIVGHRGSYRSAGVGGGIGGMGADLLIIDDPVKDVAEAQSETVRENVKDWFGAVAYLRLQPGGGVILCMTRWHMDDLAGHLLKQSASGESEKWEEVRFPGVAEGEDVLGRQEGDPLDPVRYPKAALDRIKATIGTWQFSTLYQQRPVPREGSIFKRSWFGPDKRVRVAPAEAKVVRGWDLASSVKKRSKYTAGVRLSMDNQGVLYIEHALRFREGPGQVEKMIHAVSKQDKAERPQIRISIPQDPGQAAKSQVLAFTKLLHGFDVRFSPESGEKTDRANPFSAQCEGGNVRIIETGSLLRDAWIEPFLDELCGFPGGEFSDQTDATSRAYTGLLEMSDPVETYMFLDQVGLGGPEEGGYYGSSD
jgi:predicted phage terminase large subunit-like protein